MKYALWALPKWSASRPNSAAIGGLVPCSGAPRGRHAADDSQAEDVGVVGGPVGEIGGHVPEGRADLQHPPRPGVCQQRQHGVRIGRPV